LVSCFKKMRIKNNINFTRQKIYFNYRMSKNITGVSKNITGVNNNVPYYNELTRSRANTPVYPEETRPNSNKFRKAAARLKSLFNPNTPVPSSNNQSGTEPVGGKRKRAHHKRTRRNKRKGTRRNKRKGTRRNKRN